MPSERVVFVHGAGSFGAAAWPRQHGLALDYDCLFIKRHGFDAVAEPLAPDLEADIAIIREALDLGTVAELVDGRITAGEPAVPPPTRRMMPPVAGFSGILGR